MTISFDVTAENDWLSPAGEIRRHAQLLIVDRSIVELMGHAFPDPSAARGLSVTNGVFVQNHLIQKTEVRPRLVIRSGVVDRSGLAMRLAFSVRTDECRESLALSLFGVRASEDRLDLRRALLQTEANSALSWDGPDLDGCQSLFPHVPLPSPGSSRKGLLWTSLCLP